MILAGLARSFEAVPVDGVFAVAGPAELLVDGVENTVPLFDALLQEPDIQSGNYNIHWLEAWLEKNLQA